MKLFTLVLLTLLLAACEGEESASEPKGLQSYWISTGASSHALEIDLRTPGRVSVIYPGYGSCECDAIVTETSLTGSNCAPTGSMTCGATPGIATFAFTPGTIEIRMDNNAQIFFE